MYPSPWAALEAKDSHPDTCADPSWSPWGWVVSYTIEGRICGTCRHWEFKYHDLL